MSDLDGVNFPSRIARNAQFRRRTSSQIISFEGGGEQVAQLRDQTLWSYECGLVPMTYEEAIEAADAYNSFIDILSGPADVFRFKDPVRDRNTLEFSNGVLQSIASGVLIGSSGFGGGTPDAQIQRKSSYQGVERYKNIQKPVSSTVVVRRNSIVLSVGSDYTLNASRGVVTFSPDESKLISSISVGTTTDIVLPTPFSSLIVGEYVYLSGITGSAAALLNGQSYEVLAIVSSTYTLAVDTSGLVATAGNASVYPQPSEALDVSCTFDIPCRLELDDVNEILFGRSFDSEMMLEMPSIPIVEFPLDIPV